MRFTVLGTWHQQPVEVMWDDGSIQGPRDLLLDRHLRALLDSSSQETDPVSPGALLDYLRDALDTVEGVWADDGHPMLEIRGPEQVSVSHSP